MSKSKMWILSLLTVAVIIVAGAEIFAESDTTKAAFEIRKVPEQVVLYTIHRGSYDKSGMAIGKLYALAGQKGLRPRGVLSYAYLNNPKLVSSDHWLTEIRIPVDKEALKLASKLGEMTDVKTLPEMDVAVAVKPKGLKDPSSIYRNLYYWIFEQGYMVTDAHCETFLSGTETGDYAQMKSEIMVPVTKLATKDN